MKDKNIEQTHKKVVLYMRYSSDNQNYASIEAQRRANTTYCEDNGFEIVREYVDEAKSATSDARPNFKKMIDDCSKLNIDAIVVHKLDRFSRNKAQAYFYKALLEKKGIDIISVIEPLNDSPESGLMEGIILAVNEFYSQNLGREVQKGKKEAAYKCLNVGGLPPYGYDLDDDRKYIINPIESKGVKLIFDMYINGYSYQQIADYLNNRGYRTKKRLKFNKNSFSSILENAERYTGIYIYNRAASKYSNGQRNSHKYKSVDEIIRIEGGIPRIIDDDTYKAVIAKKDTNREICGKFHSKRYYLLNGLMTCGECGRAYSGNTNFAGRNKTEYATYRCGGYRGDECDNKDVNLKYINDFVLTQLRDIIFNSIRYDDILKVLNRKLAKNRDNNKNRIIKMKNDINNNAASIRKLTDLLVESDNSEAIIDKIKELEANKAVLESKLDELENNKDEPFDINDMDNVKQKFNAYLKKIDRPMCRKMIRAFIDRIDVYKDRIEVTIKTDK